ncbi:YqgE/AlgH family protein [Capnocytophaga canimorsus]|uniref:YqgE/AlgH family protein n=1 Tax=Capnocytophaga canimorsus TaxID=28188 RepID=UPI00384CE442
MNRVQKGNILIAEPSMIGDVIFSRSVVFLTDHGIEGTVGFVLNKPSEFYLDAFFDVIPDNFRIYHGGPVQQDSLYFIHSRPDIIEHSFHIGNGIYWGGNFKQIIEQINLGNLKTNEIKFFLGYSGWAEGQLEAELDMNAWVISDDIVPSQLFLSGSASLWRERIKTLGDEYLLWINTPENPQLN